MDWLPLSLLCALFLASADAATKAWLQGFSARELVLVRFGVTGLLMTPLLADLPPLTSLPPAFWAWLAALVPLELGAMLLYMRAIRDYPLSLTLPYAIVRPLLFRLDAERAHNLALAALRLLPGCNAQAAPGRIFPVGRQPGLRCPVSPESKPPKAGLWQPRWQPRPSG